MADQVTFDPRRPPPTAPPQDIAPSAIDPVDTPSVVVTLEQDAAPVAPETSSAPEVRLEEADQPATPQDLETGETTVATAEHPETEPDVEVGVTATMEEDVKTEPVDEKPSASESAAAMDAAIAATLAALGPDDGSPAETVVGDQNASASANASLPAGLEDEPMRDATAIGNGISTPLYPQSSESTPNGTPAPTPVIPLPRQSRFSDATPSSTVDEEYVDPARVAAQAFAARVAKIPAPVSRVAQLTARVENDPLDGEARLALLADAEQKGDLERTREVYEDFLKIFPDATQQWIAYANLELSHSLFQNVEAIFGRCLRLSPAVELWKFYLDYIRRVNPVDASLGDRAKEARGTISKAFEYALQHVGQDRRAGDIWMEYIAFLKEGQNRGTWEDQQRMDALRKAYQRAVCIPLNNVEAIWQEYNSFENNLNKMTAKKFVAELSPSYMTARKALRELRAMYDHLASPLLPHRPDWSEPTDRGALSIWRRYLAWEEANPLDIEEPAALQSRVSFAYKKAVAALRFYSEIWYLAADYNLKQGRPDDARTFLQTGLTANPSSLLLGYTLAELEEGRQEYAACHKIYDGLLEHFHSRLATLSATIDREITEAHAGYEAQQSIQEMEGADDEGRQKHLIEKEEIKAEVVARKQAEVDTAKKGAANVWIAQMRFARRAEGIKQARGIFTRARKSPHLVWQVVEASATMELHWNNEPKIATNVFELGLKTFSKDPEYVLQYLDFLIRSNNPNNARALFERTVALVEPAKAKPVWDRMAQYENQYGDYLAAQKILTRYSEAFPDASPIERFAQRHGYLGLDDSIKQDLGTEPVSRPQKSGRGRDDRRSPSPARGTIKRGASAEPFERAGSVERASYGGLGSGDFKRSRPNSRIEGSPAPSSNGGDGPRVPGWGPNRRGDDFPPPPGGRDDFDVGRRRPLDGPPPPPAFNRPVPFMLDPRGENVAVLPDAVVFFLSILPTAASFHGPMLNPASIVDVIGSTLLPGTAPGPGLPGERLGIPPRPKPMGGPGPGPTFQDRPMSPRRGGGGGGQQSFQTRSCSCTDAFEYLRRAGTGLQLRESRQRG
ncbi:cleavage stimulation factor subunit 3, partial [Phenoliferia sp. Uapishka_3]